MKTKQTRLLASRRRFRAGFKVVMLLSAATLGALGGGAIANSSLGVNIALVSTIPLLVALVYTAVQADRVETKLLAHYRDHDLFIKDRHQESHAINMGGREDE